MIHIRGKAYPTIVDAAQELGVSAKTVRSWIDTGVIPPPPTVDWGMRTIEVFSSGYLARAKSAMKARRDGQRRQPGLKGSAK